jgi:hypothetical protein
VQDNVQDNIDKGGNDTTSQTAVSNSADLVLSPAAAAAATWTLSSQAAGAINDVSISCNKGAVESLQQQASKQGVNWDNVKDPTTKKIDDEKTTPYNISSVLVNDKDVTISPSRKKNDEPKDEKSVSNDLHATTDSGSAEIVKIVEDAQQKDPNINNKITSAASSTIIKDAVVMAGTTPSTTTNSRPIDSSALDAAKDGGDLDDSKPTAVVSTCLATGASITAIVTDQAQSDIRDQKADASMPPPLIVSSIDDTVFTDDDRQLAVGPAEKCSDGNPPENTPAGDVRATTTLANKEDKVPNDATKQDDSASSYACTTAQDQQQSTMPVQGSDGADSAETTKGDDETPSGIASKRDTEMPSGTTTTSLDQQPVGPEIGSEKAADVPVTTIQTMDDIEQSSATATAQDAQPTVPAQTFESKTAAAAEDNAATTAQAEENGSKFVSSAAATAGQDQQVSGPETPAENDSATAARPSSDRTLVWTKDNIEKSSAATNTTTAQDQHPSVPAKDSDDTDDAATKVQANNEDNKPPPTTKDIDKSSDTITAQVQQLSGPAQSFGKGGSEVDTSSVAVVASSSVTTISLTTREQIKAVFDDKASSTDINENSNETAMATSRVALPQEVSDAKTLDSVEGPTNDTIAFDMSESESLPHVKEKDSKDVTAEIAPAKTDIVVRRAKREKDMSKLVLVDTAGDETCGSAVSSDGDRWPEQLPLLAPPAEQRGKEHFKDPSTLLKKDESNADGDVHKAATGDKLQPSVSSSKAASSVSNTTNTGATSADTVIKGALSTEPANKDNHTASKEEWPAETKSEAIDVTENGDSALGDTSAVGKDTGAITDIPLSADKTPMLNVADELKSDEHPRLKQKDSSAAEATAVSFTGTVEENDVKSAIDGSKPVATEGPDDTIRDGSPIKAPARDTEVPQQKSHVAPGEPVLGATTDSGDSVPVQSGSSVEMDTTHDVEMKMQEKNQVEKTRPTRGAPELKSTLTSSSSLTHDKKTSKVALNVDVEMTRGDDGQGGEEDSSNLGKEKPKAEQQGDASNDSVETNLVSKAKVEAKAEHKNVGMAGEDTGIDMSPTGEELPVEKFVKTSSAVGAQAGETTNPSSQVRTDMAKPGPISDAKVLVNAAVKAKAKDETGQDEKMGTEHSASRVENGAIEDEEKNPVQVVGGSADDNVTEKDKLEIERGNIVAMQSASSEGITKGTTNSKMINVEAAPLAALATEVQSSAVVSKADTLPMDAANKGATICSKEASKLQLEQDKSRIPGMAHSSAVATGVKSPTGTLAQQVVAPDGAKAEIDSGVRRKRDAVDSVGSAEEESKRQKREDKETIDIVDQDQTENNQQQQPTEDELPSRRKKSVSLDQMKLLIFTEGSRVHRVRGYEQFFTEYWMALSTRLEGRHTESIGEKCRSIIDCFLKTRRLKKLHNKLILGTFGLAGK